MFAQSDIDDKMKHTIVRARVRKRNERRGILVTWLTWSRSWQKGSVLGLHLVIQQDLLVCTLIPTTCLRTREQQLNESYSFIHSDYRSVMSKGKQQLTGSYCSLAHSTCIGYQRTVRPFMDLLTLYLTPCISQLLTTQSVCFAYTKQ